MVVSDVVRVRLTSGVDMTILWSLLLLPCLSHGIVVGLVAVSCLV